MMSKEEGVWAHVSAVHILCMRLTRAIGILINLVYSDFKNHDHYVEIVFVISVVTIVKYVLDFSERV